MINTESCGDRKQREAKNTGAAADESGQHHDSPDEVRFK